VENIILFLEDHYVSLFLILFIAFAIILMINWLAWIFSFGRFTGQRSDPQAKGLYLLGEFIVNIINDFRHLLALILVLIFAASLGYAFYSSKNVDELSKALQVVVSTLGGLVGSIVGYYFGESAVKKANEERVESRLNTPIIQERVPPIQDVTPPENL
jgi:hypothetical protein